MGGKTEVRPILKVVSIGLGDKLKEKGEGEKVTCHTSRDISHNFFSFCFCNVILYSGFCVSNITSVAESTQYNLPKAVHSISGYNRPQVPPEPHETLSVTFFFF